MDGASGTVPCTHGDGHAVATDACRRRVDRVCPGWNRARWSTVDAADEGRLHHRGLARPVARDLLSPVDGGGRAVGSKTMNLDGKVALVTGSSSGIGEAVARSLAAAGASVVVNSANSVEAGQKVAASLPRAVYVQGDIGDADACTALLRATLDQFGRLDVLVNNAEIGRAHV